MKHGGFPKCACGLYSVVRVGKLCAGCDPHSKERKGGVKIKEEAVKTFLDEHSIVYEREKYITLGLLYFCFSHLCGVVRVRVL